MAQAAQQAMALQTATDACELFARVNDGDGSPNEPALILGIAGKTQPDLSAGGANPQPMYDNNPLAAPTSIVMCQMLYAGTHGQLNDQDGPRLAQLDATQVATFGAQGEVYNLHNTGLFRRMVTVGITVTMMRTGIGVLGIVPIDIPTEQGLLIGNGFANWLRGRVHHLAGGPLAVGIYLQFFQALQLLRPNFFAQHPEVIIANNARAQLQHQINAGAGGAGAGGAGGAGAGGAGANNVNANGVLKMLEDIPLFNVASLDMKERERLTMADAQILANIGFWQVRWAQVTFSVRIQGMMKATREPAAQSLFLTTNTTRANAGINDQNRYYMLIAEIRAYLSRNAATRVKQLDKGFLTNVGFEPGDNLRMLMLRLTRQDEIFTMIYTVAELREIYGGLFRTQAVDAILSAMDNGIQKYSLWVTNQPVRANITFQQIQAFADTEEVQPQVSRRRRVQGIEDVSAGDKPDGAANDDEQPVFQTASRTGGTISSEIVQGLTPVLQGIRDEVASLAKVVESTSGAIDHLSEEHKILRKGMSNRSEFGDAAFTVPAVAATSSASSQSQSQPSSSVEEPPRLNFNLVAAAMDAGRGSDRTRSAGKAPVAKPEFKRTKVDLEEVKRNAPIWHELAIKLMKKAGKTPDDECVICVRGANSEISPRRKHPLNECGLLFTLTKAGQEWFQGRMTALNSRAQGQYNVTSKMLLDCATGIAQKHGFTDDELDAAVCQVCEDKDRMAFINLCNDKWIGEGAESVVADYGEKVSRANA